MSIAKVGDINLYYEVHGKGAPLVLIMGYTHRGGQWAELRDKLAGEYCVIVPDNRGTGQSDKPEMRYTTKMMAADVAGLLDVLGIGATNVFGYSMGGMIAQEFALSYPGRLDNLILCATHCGGNRAVWNPEAMAFFSDPELAKLSDEGRARASIPWIWNKEFVENNPAAIERFIATTVEHPTPLQARLSHQNVLMTHDTYERLPDIKAPTLVIAGSEDLMIPCENSKLLASRIPNAEPVIVENAGHGVFVSDPTEKVWKMVLDFLRRHSKARAKN
jgi:3-oxoadipate enol-lactonase